jgi:predicted RNase H-like HicB family nuclease
MNPYGMTVQWSAEDELYIARAPQFPLLAAHGDTPEEAVRELGVAIEAMIEIMKEEG